MRWYLECLKKYAVFTGRARRMEYWMFALGNFIVLMAVTIIEMAARGDAVGDGGSVLAGLLQLALFLPSLSVGVRRMHDTSHSGWWLLVPIANLVFACMDGEHGDNRFGPDPKTTLSTEPSRLAAARA